MLRNIILAIFAILQLKKIVQDILMKHSKKILMAATALIALMFLGAGCISVQRNNLSTYTNDSTNSDFESTIEKVDEDETDTGIDQYLKENAETEEKKININDWTQYINDTYGLEFKYPKDWIAREFSDEKKLAQDRKLSIYLSPPKTTSPNDFEMSIVLFEDDIEEYKYQKNDNRILINEEKGELNGSQAITTITKNITTGHISTIIRIEHPKGTLMVAYNDHNKSTEIIASTILIK